MKVSSKPENFYNTSSQKKKATDFRTPAEIRNCKNVRPKERKKEKGIMINQNYKLL